MSFEVGYSRVLREYKIWTGIISRCKPYHKDHTRYFDRGITVCKKWHKFENFYKDMGPRPSPKHSIDRINNNKGYKPSNCRWATPYEQHNNKRQNVKFTIDGITKNLKEWCRIYKISHQAVRYRLNIGLDIKEALTINKNHGNRFI